MPKKSPTPEFLRDLAQRVQRPDLSQRREITKMTALRYLLPEILRLRGLGVRIDDIRDVCRAGGLDVSRPTMMQALSVKAILTEADNG